MDFPQPLVRARLVQRYKRFLADVVLHGTGEALTAHVPNPGAMLGLNMPGLDVWLSRSSSPTRKLPYTLEMVEAEGGLVGVNTKHPHAYRPDYPGARLEVKPRPPQVGWSWTAKSRSTFASPL